jgi:bidirectional [NiFe] hydrogenase diaphorase subunit
MFAYLDNCEPPSDDKRWKAITATMRTLGNDRHALIETLHAVQQAFGYLDRPSLIYVAASLRIPLSQVFGAATFYSHFTMKPQGQHSCVVCTGTACHIKGTPALIDAVTAVYGVSPGETTDDHRLTLSTARCFGTCGLAPVVTIDEEMIGPVNPLTLEHRLEEVIESAR